MKQKKYLKTFIDRCPYGSKIKIVKVPEDFIFLGAYNDSSPAIALITEPGQEQIIRLSEQTVRRILVWLEEYFNETGKIS